ncbi:MAG: tRNA pseudouridine(38-40) synthase TruA [Bacteroidota bacterium]
MALNRYFIFLSYRGTNFHGWQIQENAISVQGYINNALSILLKEDIQTIGAGRTDTGVHAKFYVAHFDTNADYLETDSKFLHSLNRIVPNDIAIHAIRRVKPDANARFDATLRGYEYVICRKKDPFWIGLAWFYDAQLNIENMQLAAQQLFNYTDFTSFSKVGSNTRTNNCIIFKAEWCENDNLLIFNIEANRFLRNMVRAIVGTLMEVGRGKITPEEFALIIEKRDRKLAGTSAPAEGLYLTRIEYPDKCFY